MEQRIIELIREAKRVRGYFNNKDIPALAECIVNLIEKPEPLTLEAMSVADLGFWKEHHKALAQERSLVLSDCKEGSKDYREHKDNYDYYARRVLMFLREINRREALIKFD